MLTKGTITSIVLGSLVLVVALVLGISATPEGINDDTVPIITSIIAIVAVLIPTIVAQEKAERANDKLDRLTDELHNGLIEGKVTDALNERDESTNG